ncbi:MAG: pantoate--beta-alanine ligase [Planctomycetota bacterium]|nr:pantoate--beta-alanine ligase [Planctomycetota bacterium]
MSIAPPAIVPPAGLAIEETIAGLRRRVAAARKREHRIGLVPTMGALHAGHVSLIEAARQSCGYVAVSIFVNPTQFGPNEDFARYPRTIEADLQVCYAAGADVVFLPSAPEVYPAGSTTWVSVEGLSDVLEGAVRPGHFRGVATVVLKLFNIVGPDVAFFGAKDYQQQLLIRRVVTDLNLPLEIVTAPTIREPDGLAMSSRNRYLDESERRRATAISAALFAAQKRLQSGERDLAAIKSEMRRSLEAAGLQVDYAIVCDLATLEELEAMRSHAVLLVAARLGTVRLIDNLEVTLDESIRRRGGEPTRTPLLWGEGQG